MYVPAERAKRGLIVERGDGVGVEGRGSWGKEDRRGLWANIWAWREGPHGRREGLRMCMRGGREFFFFFFYPSRRGGD